MALTDEEKEKAIKTYTSTKDMVKASKKNASSAPTESNVNKTRSGVKLEDQKSYKTAQEKALNPVGMPANRPAPKVASAEVLSSTAPTLQNRDALKKEAQRNKSIFRTTQTDEINLQTRDRLKAEQQAKATSEVQNFVNGLLQNAANDKKIKEQVTTKNRDAVKAQIQEDVWQTNPDGSYASNLGRGLGNRFRSTVGNAIEDISEAFVDATGDVVQGYSPENEITLENRDAAKAYIVGENSAWFVDPLRAKADEIARARNAGKVYDLATEQITQAQEGTNSQFARDMISAADSGVQMAAYMALPGGAQNLSLYMAIPAAAERYNTERANGASKEEAANRAAATGVISYAVESLGGIGKVGSNIIEDVAAKNFFTNLAAQFASEGGEEILQYGFQYVADALADLMYKGKIQTTFDPVEMLHNAWVGGLAGGGFGAVGSISNSFTGNAQQDATISEVMKDIVAAVKNASGVVAPSVQTTVQQEISPEQEQKVAPENPVEQGTPQDVGVKENQVEPPIEQQEIPDPTIEDKPLSDDEIQANIDKLRKQLVKEQPQPEQVTPQVPTEQTVLDAQPKTVQEGGAQPVPPAQTNSQPPIQQGAQTEEPVVTPQKEGAQEKGLGAQKQNTDVLLQNMDALGGEVDAQEGSFEGSGKKSSTQLSVKEILNMELTEREAERYKARVDALKAYKDGGYKSLNDAQRKVIDKLFELDLDMTPKGIDKTIEKYEKKLYGNNTSTKSKAVAFPRLDNMRKEIFNGKKYTLEEINSLPEIQEAKKRAHLDNKETSITKFRSPETLEWTTERKAIQDKIVAELMSLGSAVIDEKGKVQYNGVVEKGLHADIVIGPPAAGKSTVFADPLSQQHKARIIDSDMIKERLPEFDGGYGANFIHEESASVADTDLKNKAIEQGENVVFPLVGGKTAKIRKLIELLRSKGYTVNLYYNEVPAEVAMNRAFARFIQNGRFLPLDYVAGIYSDKNSNPTVTYYTLLKEGVADYYEHKSNDVPYGTEPPFVEDPSGRDLYRPGNKGGVRHEQPIRPGRSSNGRNIPAGNRTAKGTITQQADAESTGSFNAPKNPENVHDVGIGARRSGENPVAEKAAEYGTYDVPKDSYTDYDDYTSRNEVSPADRKTLTEQTVYYGDKDVPYSKAIVEMVMDEVKFSEQKGKYFANGMEIPKAAYDFGKFLEENGVKYWNNKAEQFPKQWDDKNYVSRFIRNIASSKFGTDKTIELLEESLKNGKFIYERRHNKEVIGKAKKYITLHGFEESMKEWVNFANGNTKVSPKELVDKIALGEMLADVAFEINDHDTAKRILMDVSAWGTGMGQGVQVLSHLRKLGKNGEAPFKLDKSNAEYYVDRTLHSLNARYEDKLKGKQIELSDKLKKEWLDAIGTDNEFEVTKKVFGEIANQIPSSWFDRFNSWRYFCMLCAPSTHTKNITSNVAMSGADFLKDVYLARFEKAYQKKHPDYVRTASATTNSADRKFAKGTYEEANARFGQSGTRYSSEDSGLESLRTNTFGGANYKFAKGTRQFIGKGVDKLVNSVSDLLEAEDTMTKKGIYSRKVAEIMKANGWTEEYFNSGTTQAIRDFEYAQERAIKDAYKATFNDPNKVQKLLSAWRKMPNKTVSDKVKRFALGALVEITFPFKKVSANIPARAIEYSPVGIVQGLLELKFDGKNDDFDPTEALNHVAAGAAGSSITLAGTILGILGLAQLTGGDESEDELKENAGWKNYSLKIGDYYIALDDIAPVTTMLMGGVKLAQEIGEIADSYKEGTRGFEFASAVTGSLLELAAFGIDGILQLDFLSSIKDLMTSYGSETGTMDVFGKKIEGVAESLVGQVEPNILRKIMRTIEDDYANAYYYDKNVDTPQWIQNIKSGAMLLVPDRKIEQFIADKSGKKVDIPGYSDLAKRYDKWGRSINPEDFWVKAANNLGSPFQISKDRSTHVDKELERVYGETKDPSLVPPTAAKYFSENGKTIYMTAKQYSDYSKALGETRFKMLDELFKSKYYKNLSEGDKAIAIKAAYDLASDSAKDDVFGERTDTYSGKKVSRTSGYDVSKTDGLSTAAYIANKAVYSRLPNTATYSKNDRFYDYLVADKTTSAKDDILLLETFAGKDFDNYRTATESYEEILNIYDAVSQEGGKAEDIEYLSEKYNGNDLKAFALYSTSTANKNYENGEFKFGNATKQVEKANRLLASGKLDGDKIAKGARAITGLADYLGKNRKTKKNYIAVLMEVGFTKEEANIFFNSYGW